MKKLIYILQLVLLMAIVGVLMLDKEYYLRCGYSVINMVKPYTCLPYSTHYSRRHDMTSIKGDFYQLYTPYEGHRDLELYYTTYDIVDLSGKEECLVPYKIMKYAYSETELCVQVKDTTGSVLWVTPSFIGKSLYNFNEEYLDKKYDYLVLTEEDIDFTKLKVIDIESQATFIIDIVYSLFILLIFLLFPVPFILLAYKRFHKPNVY